MMDRLVYTLRWDEERKAWLVRDGQGNVLDIFTSGGRVAKKEAVSYAAGWARDRYMTTSELTQLRVFNKNGRISFERTYGKDPKRYKG